MKAKLSNGARGLAMLVAAGALAAQATLRERIVAAAAGDDFLVALGALVDEAGAGAFLDAAVAVDGDLTPCARACVAGALSQRYPALEATWNGEPARRRARAPLFARVAFGWAERWARAADGERRDIEAVARWIEPDDHVLRDTLRDRDGSHHAAALALLREAARGTRERGDPLLALLRRVHGSDDERDELVRRLREPRVSPFVFAPLLAEADARFRLRGAIALRASLHLPPSSVLHARLADDPWGPFPGLSPPDAIADACIARWLAQIEAGERPLEPYSPWSGGSDHLRRRLARTMLAAVLAELPRAARGTERTDGNREQWLRAYTTVALQLDDDAIRLLLGEAIQTSSVERAVEVLDLVARCTRHLPRDAARRTAGMVDTLLDHGDERVRVRAVQVAAAVLANDPESPLRPRIGALALRSIAEALAALRDPPRVLAHAGGPRHETPPVFAVVVVTVAAYARERRLVEPLLTALAAQRRAPDRDEASRREAFLLRCLRPLLPELGPAEADRACDLLLPPPSPGFDAASRERLQVTDAAWLLRAVSAARFPLACADAVAAFGQSEVATVCSGLLLTERMLLLLDGLDLDRYEHGPLHRHCPERLAAEWIAGEQRAETAATVVRRIDDWAWAESQRAAGVLPVPLLASAIAATNLPTVVPVSLLAACRDQPCLAASLSVRVGCARGDAGDLAAWRHVAAAARTPVALAAVRRLAGLGERGRAAAIEALQRLLAAAELTTVHDALSTSVELELSLADVPEALARLAGNEDPTMRVSGRAVARRLGALALESSSAADAAQVLRESGVDVDAARLARVLPAPTAVDLALLVTSRSAATCVTALAAAARLARWSPELEREVALTTTHPDAGVRAAAYHALATRDPDLVAAAWLVHEAEFDPDPAVRAVAASAPRERR